MTEILSYTPRFTTNDCIEFEAYIEANGYLKDNITLIYCDETNAETFFDKYFNEEYSESDKIKMDNFIKSHRAFYTIYKGKPVIVVYFTKYETMESVLWLTLYELVIHSIENTPLINRYMSKCTDELADTLRIDRTEFREDHKLLMNDLIHQNLEKVKFASNVASKLLGKKLDREWWRGNIAHIDSLE